jgi:hypothetical protein
MSHNSTSFTLADISNTERRDAEGGATAGPTDNCEEKRKKTV